MIAFIDEIALPFLTSLYGAVGYVGVLIAMAIESAMIPLPSELILPLAGFMVSDPDEAGAADGAALELLDRGRRGDHRQHAGLAVAYAIGAWGGRPFLERYGKYMLIREHELEAADRFFARYGAATVFIGRLLPIVRTFISFPAGVARMPIGKFILYSTLGALPWSIALVWAGVQLGTNWVTIRDMLKPFDMAIAVGVVVLFLGLPVVAAGHARTPEEGADRRPGRRREPGRRRGPGARRRLTPTPRACRRGPRRCARSLTTSELRVLRRPARLPAQHREVRLALREALR